MSVGENIRRYRKSRGMTQAQLAEAVGLTPDLLLSTWDLRPFTPTSSFLVAILRRS